MLAGVRQWRSQLTRREQRLIDFAVALTALVVLVYGIVLPVGAGFDAAATRHTDAVRRSAKLLEAVDAIDRKPHRLQRGAPNLDQALSRSAQAAGLMIQSNDRQGSGQVHASLVGANSAMALSWLVRLDGDGLRIVNLAVRPANDGTVVLDLVIDRP